MESPGSWTLADSSARFEGPAGHLELDLARPNAGLSWRLGKAAGSRFLQVHWPGAGEADTPQDAYIRGRDLIVSYGSARGRDIRPHACWRVAGGDDYGLQIQLLLSAETDLLTSHPATRVVCEWGPGQILRGGHAQERGEQASPDARFAAPHEATILLWQSAAEDCSEAMFIDPHDFHQGEIVTRQTGGTRAAFDLFPNSLEKGVIRRARLGGIVAAHPCDWQTVRRIACRQQQQAPPLTT